MKKIVFIMLNVVYVIAAPINFAATPVALAHKLSTAIVNVGTGLNTTGALNNQIIPSEVTIKAGGVVTFVVSGFHQIAVYAPETQPEKINIELLDGRLIDDPFNRVYLGLDPRGDDPNLNGSRVEAVQFDEPGLYLVICSVRQNFVNNSMFGFVNVLPADDRTDGGCGANAIKIAGECFLHDHIPPPPPVLQNF